jgi:hypothetical protein
MTSTLRLARDVRATLTDPDGWFRNANERGPRWRLDPAAALRTVRMRHPRAFEVFGEAVITASVPGDDAGWFTNGPGKPNARKARTADCRWCLVRNAPSRSPELDPPPYDAAHRALLHEPCAKFCRPWLTSRAVAKVHPDDWASKTAGGVVAPGRAAAGDTSSSVSPATPLALTASNLGAMRRLGIDPRSYYTTARPDEGESPEAFLRRRRRPKVRPAATQPAGVRARHYYPAGDRVVEYEDRGAGLVATGRIFPVGGPR